MIKTLIAIWLIANCSLIYAQTIKTDVLVVGGSASGVAAAIQCARSKVKTIFAISDSLPHISTAASGMNEVSANRDLPSGIWGEFRKQVQDFYKKTPGYDTAYNAVLRFEPNAGATILKKITDTVKNLTVYLNSSFITIKKDGDYWQVNIIQNGKSIEVKAHVVVDATENGELASKAGAKITAGVDNNKVTNELKTYRTSIAAGKDLPRQVNLPGSYYPPLPVYCIPLSTVLLKDADNLLITEKALSGKKDIQYLPLQLELGQGVGAVAAYCAFFKTTTKNLKVRIIQGELLDFKSYLLPFADIPLQDRNWRAIQQVCATGLLKGVKQATGNSIQFLFKPDSAVSTNEIKPVLTEIYTRAFLWFNKEKPGEKFTIGNLLALISDYTLTDPKVFNTGIQKSWKTQYKFKLDFDLNRQVTRREFAVLTNKFLNPFARTVDLEGRLVN
ncbi:MAG: hypothetical protein JWQ63_4074 [Mucilaginibacter sp.]|nr:hypothetical protein [Mucilaginibacter sp.]